MVLDEHGTTPHCLCSRKQDHTLVLCRAIYDITLAIVTSSAGAASDTDRFGSDELMETTYVTQLHCSCLAYIALALVNAHITGIGLWRQVHLHLLTLASLSS